MRKPSADDGAAVWELVRGCGTLELNTPYAYLLLCSHFAETSLVAEKDGRLFGVVCAYRPPMRPSNVFVWQIGVHPEARGCGLGLAMLDEIAARLAPRGVRSLSATVTPSNRPSRALFEAFARGQGAQVLERPGFPAEQFPAGEAHEPELTLEIGPLSTSSRRTEGASTS